MILIGNASNGHVGTPIEWGTPRVSTEFCERDGDRLINWHDWRGLVAVQCQTCGNVKKLARDAP